ncbi:uncharacterized protein DUF4440 [Chitinophaga niastensis]|uniref:Uncharacterized protein DUF4440 n=1 Tax=Chitinophaga niastensis TaxID=536980 RepID=A0A2P8HDM3_CHINA|nr:nuclear transport factor 2 family protein [Chitinophaga niastensis]PSL44313.1 uncharacterized protein DUF4440 [Chitinophaga niastensis]
MKSIRVLISILCFNVLINVTVQAQSSTKTIPSISLEDQLNAKDSLLFDVVFHTCKLQDVESVFTPDFEYYQDKGDQQSVSLTSRSEFIGNIKRKCERGNGGMQIKRVASNVQTFPLKDDGAMQTGIQRFYLLVPGKADQLMEVSRFSRVWVSKNGDWKIQRELDNVLDMPQHQNAAMKEQTVYIEIAHMDSVLFNAFNQHDFKTLKSVFSEDMEFYQDKTGFTGYAWNMDNFKKHLEDPSLYTRRELVEGSLEVYPMNGYGAVEMGVHRFYGKQNGQERLEATARFVTLWQKKDGHWKITREISFDHQ